LRLLRVEEVSLRYAGALEEAILSSGGTKQLDKLKREKRGLYCLNNI
jgi:hypothetical protein